MPATLKFDIKTVLAIMVKAAYSVKSELAAVPMAILTPHVRHDRASGLRRGCLSGFYVMIKCGTAQFSLELPVI